MVSRGGEGGGDLPAQDMKRGTNCWYTACAHHDSQDSFNADGTALSGFCSRRTTEDKSLLLWQQNVVKCRQRNKPSFLAAADSNPALLIVWGWVCRQVWCFQHTNNKTTRRQNLLGNRTTIDRESNKYVTSRYSTSLHLHITYCSKFTSMLNHTIKQENTHEWHKAHFK